MEQVKTAVASEPGAERNIAMVEKALAFRDLLAKNDNCTVLYINAQDVSAVFLEHVKTAFFTEVGAETSMAMEETTLAFRDLLAKTRKEVSQQALTSKNEVNSPCFWLLDKHSAAKGAVQCIETYHLPYDDNSAVVKGMSVRWPSAATTRKFYAEPARAYNIACCIEIGHFNFDETLDCWTDLRNTVLPNFPWQVDDS